MNHDGFDLLQRFVNDRDFEHQHRQDGL